MRIKLLISILFVAIAIVITTGVLLRSSILGSDQVEAGSFGISPPYIKAVDLKPGDSHKQSIRVVRGDSNIEQKVTARFDDLEIVDWFVIYPSETIIIEKGKKYANFVFELKVPLDAYNGDYQGKLYFAISSNTDKSGVSISLGARANIDISVIGGRGEFLSSSVNTSVEQLADNSLVERLQGRFVMRSESYGQIYYLHPGEKRIYYFSNSEDFLKLLGEEGRGISNILLSKIALDLSNLEGVDSDSDGLPDLWEDSLSTDINVADTDGDGFDDLEELNLGFSPWDKDRSMEVNLDIAESLSGFLLLQVESRGQVWYVSPVNNKRILLVDIDNILSILEKIALGISEKNYQRLIEK